MNKTSIITLLCLLSGLSLGAQAPSGNSLFGSLRARQIGPAVTSGRISTLAVVPNQTETVYVGTAGGGVWKSVSGGTTVRPVFDDHTQSIGKIAIDPQKPDVVWVGAGEPWVRNSVSEGNGIYKTANGGTNWEHKGLAETGHISDIIIHPANSDVLYVGAQGHLWNANAERGVFKTSDGGKTWEKVLYIDENTGCADLSIDPQNPDILYAAMWSYRRSPWFFDSGFTGKSGLYKSTDGGKTWNTIHNGLPNETLGRMAVAVAPSNGNVIYLSVECKSKDLKGLYLSTDQGASWKKVSTDFNTTVRPFYFANMVVDPKNDSIVMKCGLNAIISEDRGERFRGVDGSVHSDIHDIWINPNNTKHILLATDGGVYESLDRGRTFRMWMNLPVGQLYHVSVDDETPYNVYCGLQDNGSWYAPSRKAGGITNSDWQSSFGGDGFYSFRHPTNKDIVFSEYQGGNLVRYSKTTGRAKEIRPFPKEGEDKYRFNWNTPIHISSSNPNRMYFAAQYLFMSEDMGDSWTRISPDLTTNDPEKQKQSQSGGLTIDNSTAENHCTIYAIAESPKDGKVVWAGTDDGNLHITADGGKTWSNVVINVPGLPKNTWVSYVEPSPLDRNTCFVTFDGHRTGDRATYVYKTTDLGKTWTNLATKDIQGHAYCVRQDLVNANLLFAGTEYGLYISADGGKQWARFENNLPKVAVHDMVIHPRDHALVMATHGRGVAIIDDITSLRQINDQVAAKALHFFETKPTVLRDPGAGGGWFGGSGNFTGPNPNETAKIVYYMSKRHTFGTMYVEVWKDGKLLRTLPAGKSAGINMVEMPTSLEKPKSAPTNNRMALFGALFGPNLPAGKYEVKLIKGKDTYNTTFSLINDPQSAYSDADREAQSTLTNKLYGQMEQLAYIYHVLGDVETKAKAVAGAKPKLKKQIDELAAKAAKLKNSLVALEGDFYIDEGERVNERLSDLYRQVSGYPGRPSQSQVDRAGTVEKELADVQRQFDELTGKSLKTVNDALTAAKLKAIIFATFQEFKEDKVAGSGSSGNGQGYRILTTSPLGMHWFSSWLAN